jgi:hypothetical protein
MVSPNQIILSMLTRLCRSLKRLFPLVGAATRKRGDALIVKHVVGAAEV